MFGFTLDIAWVGHLLAAVYRGWLLNLYNFMDGIDGTVSIEVVTTCFDGALMYILIRPTGMEQMVPILSLPQKTAV